MANTTTAGTVTCKKIFLAALALLGEPDGSCPDDLGEHATYHLAAFCTENAALDRLYREHRGLPEADGFDNVAIGLDEPFPLSERFVPAAATYLAAMLVLDENEELSDKLYGRYCDMMASLCTAIPGASQAITDIYGF